MTDFNSAAQDLLWLARRLRGVLDLAPELEKLSSLQNAQQEAQNRVDLLKAEGDDLYEKSLGAKNALEASRIAAEALVREAEARAADLEAKAVVDAQRAREELTQVAYAEVQKADDDRKAILKLIQRHKDNLQGILDQTVFAEEHLAKIKAEIESLKAKF